MSKEMESPLAGKTCFFCLDPLTHEECVRNVTGCECKIECHGRCLQDWFTAKQRIECPICHTLVESIPPPPHEVIQIIHVPIAASDEMLWTRQLRHREKSVAICCGMIMLWWIAGVIFDAVFFHS